MRGYDPYMDYCGSDDESLNPEEEARLRKEIENDPTIDWHQEGIDCQDYKRGDVIDWPEEEDGEYQAGSDSDGGYDWNYGGRLHPSAYKALTKPCMSKRIGSGGRRMRRGKRM
jgi:hypothetical protein